ncbi:DNA-binding response regulator, OmpR family, contains REC and winged-helix (wHTH) domain [Bacillus sp. OV166]|uniref:response regulator transcription factor n=1 Tax=Bacillus sp. OV166 TaxID=1882763 RepID=UPI000A2ABD97|nr:response regulator transcription factor [Bacillus sp. OV166]SMQ68874.1 DNA-binding response regulator, OmpR family, contains REC and winged-helix (wHTH) domain [Bacillus sp. OV166]
MKKNSIMVVEDEEKIARLLELELEYEGYTVTKVMDGLEAFQVYKNVNWDLILLDVMLPGISGIELLRRIRLHDKNTPVLLLTAKGSVEDKVSGLDYGANDYITKPFQIEEVLARIRAALRTKAVEQTQEDSNSLTLADLKINPKTREVFRGEEQIELTPREFDLLVYLMTNKRHVLNRDQILEAVWGYDFIGDTNVVDVYIRYVRRKMEQPNKPALIHTVRGVGYVLKEAK